MTMLTSPISLILPHYCCTCGSIGKILCESCKHDIISEHSGRCLGCLGPVKDGRCGRCNLVFERGWWVGERRDALAKLVDTSKFNSVRDGCRVQAELLHGILPILPDSTVIVPVPTIARHVRQRGYGHAELIADELARLRQLPSRQLVGRRTQFVQHGASKKQRQAQADASYRVNEALSEATTYIIVDDVYTTGSTIRAVTKELFRAGAGNVWVAVTSLQPLDEQR